MKKFFKNKWTKRAIFLFIIIIVILVLINREPTKTSYRTDVVKRDNIDSRISGSGVVTASEARTIISKVSSTIKDIYYLEGDRVEEGWVIATMDASDYESSINTQRNAIAQSELSKANIDRQVNNLKIVAPVGGYITNINVFENAYVMANTQICNISAKNKYEIVLQFTYREDNRINVGSQANVLLVDSLAYINGIVTNVGDKRIATSDGGQVIEVTITVENESIALDNIRAKATINLGTMVSESVNQNTFKQSNAYTVKSETSGTLVNLYVKEGQYIEKGSIIGQLENPDLLLSSKTTALSIESAYIQLRQMEKKLEDYKIVAPISGVITSQNLKEGDLISVGNNLTIISNRDEMEFKIAIDELDIAKLQYDNEVYVTIDAISETIDNPIIGKIKKMPLQGVAQGGVTDYHVTISFPENSDVRISMTANADIVVSSVKDVLCVPVEAINKENGNTYVQVIENDVAVKRSVKTGVSNTSYIEIKEGLAEGEKVIIPEVGGR